MEMKYEWIYKKSIPNIVVIFVFGAILIWGIVESTSSFYYKTKYRRTESELGQVRELLESATNRKSELEEQLGTITNLTGEAIEYVSREQDLLIKSGNTIREIKAAVEDLERYCDSLEFYIFSIRDNVTNYSEE